VALLKPYAREIQLEITYAAKASTPNGIEVVKKKMTNFYKLHPDVTVHAVDRAGNDIHF
jgi:hypothetical protein